MNETIIEFLVLAGAALGVGLMVLLNMVVGGVQWFQMSDPAQAHAYLKRDVLGFDPGEVSVLASEGKAALVFEASGTRLGLVNAMGDKAVVRALLPSDIKTVETHGAELVISLRDYTFQSVALVLASPEQAQRWFERVEQFRTSPAGVKLEETDHAATA